MPRPNSRHNLKNVHADQIKAAEDNGQPIRLEIKSLVDESKMNAKPFLLIHESDFPGIFKDPILKGQKLSHFHQEIDYNSDPELVEKNQA